MSAIAAIKEYYQNALEGRVTIVSHGLHRYLVALPPTNPDLGFASDAAERPHRPAR